MPNLTYEGRITYAALILIGSRKGLSRHLAQAEVVFEYRSTESSVSFQQRVEFREGFLLFIDRVWNLIAARNEVYLYQDGLFRREVATFNEVVVREALLNAIAHRDYRLGGSIFIRQYPKRLQIVSPGGFPDGITVENMLWRQAPRNRRIAEVMAKCDLVERSGQGVNLMFESCIQESKPLPDYSDSDNHQVNLVLSGEVQDERFLRFLERVGQETLASFTTSDYLLIHAIHSETQITERLRDRLPRLTQLGVIESKGLDKETNKALLLEHIKRNKSTGSPLRELQEVLPAKSRQQIQRLLVELKLETKVHVRGLTRGSRWHPGASRDSEDNK